MKLQENQVLEIEGKFYTVVINDGKPEFKAVTPVNHGELQEVARTLKKGQDHVWVKHDLTDTLINNYSLAEAVSDEYMRSFLEKKEKKQMTLNGLAIIYGEVNLIGEKVKIIKSGDTMDKDFEGDIIFIDKFNSEGVGYYCYGHMEDGEEVILGNNTIVELQ